MYIALLHRLLNDSRLNSVSHPPNDPSWKESRNMFHVPKNIHVSGNKCKRFGHLATFRVFLGDLAMREYKRLYLRKSACSLISSIHILWHTSSRRMMGLAAPFWEATLPFKKVCARLHIFWRCEDLVDPTWKPFCSKAVTKIYLL